MAGSDDTLIFDTSVNNSGLQAGLTAAQVFASNVAANITTQIASAVSSAFAAIPQKITEIGTQFESSMSQVAATMGITQAAAEFDQLSEAAKEMGESTKFSASQAADALNYLALAGYDANKSCAALPTVLNLAAAGGIELAEASDMVTDSMSALGLSMDELEGFADKMAKTSQKSNTSVAQLGQSILSVGANAQILAGGTTELMTELGILADSGLKSAEAGTALARVIKNLSTPTSAAAAELEALGVKCYDSEGNFRNMQDIFADLQASMDGFTAEQVQASLSEIFDTAALSSAKVLLSQCGERFDELSGYIDNADGSAAQMAETMSDNLTGDITICQSALEGLANTAYEKFQGTMRTAVQAVTADVGTLTESMKNGELSDSMDALAASLSNAASSAAELLADDVIPAVIKGFTLIVEHGNEIISVIAGISAAAAAMKVLSAVNSMSTAFNNAVLSVGALSTAEEIAAFKTAAVNGQLSLAKLAAGAYTGQITAATAVQGAFNAALSANPIGIVAAAIGAVVSVTGIIIGKIKEANKLTEEAAETTNKYAEALGNAREQGEKEIESSNKEIGVIKDKAERYEELRQKYDTLTKGEMAEFLSLCDELQEVLPEGTSLINEQTGAYNDLSESIKKVCENMEKQAVLNAKYKEYEEAAAQNYDIDKQLERAEQWADANGHTGAEKQSQLNAYCMAEFGLSYDDLKKTQANNQTVIDGYHQLYEDTYNDLDNSDKAIDYSTVGGTIASAEQEKGEAANARWEQNQKDLADERQETLDKLRSEWDKADHEYSIGTIKTDEELYARKAAIWAKYGDSSLQEHWQYEEDLVSLGNKISETEKANAEKAAQERADAEKAAEEERLRLEEEAAAEEERIRRDKWDHIAKLENLGLLTEEEAYEKRKEWIEEYCPVYSDEYYEYYKTVYDYEQDFSERQLAHRKEALEEELNAVKSNIDSIVSEYKAAYSEIQSNIAGYKSKLLSVAGNVFEVEETENADGTKTRKYKVNDIKAQIAKMKKYHEAMKEMRDKGASVSLLQEMQDLDPDDGLQMAQYMLSSGDFEEINALYKERDRVAQELAEDFYSPEVEALNRSTADKILDQYSELPDEFYLIGKNAAQELMLGFADGTGDLSGLFEVNASAISDASPLTADNIFGTAVTGGKALTEGVQNSAPNLSAEAEANQANAAAGTFTESILNSFTQKILEGIKNISIKNTFSADLMLDGKTVTGVVNETNQTLGRTADI